MNRPFRFRVMSRSIAISKEEDPGDYRFTHLAVISGVGTMPFRCNICGLKCC